MTVLELFREVRYDENFQFIHDQSSLSSKRKLSEMTLHQLFWQLLVSPNSSFQLLAENQISESDNLHEGVVNQEIQSEDQN